MNRGTMKTATLLLIVALLFGCAKKTDEEMYNDAVEAQKGDSIDEAIQMFGDMIKEYPQSPKVPDAMYAIGTLYQDRKKDFQKAIAIYEKVSTEYPAHPTAANALFLVGFLNNNELKNADAARKAYETFLAKYPDNQLSASARFELEHLGKEPEQILSETSAPPSKGKAKANAKR
jgi:TolA-binding protein